jgi:predicted RNA-binding protein YlqC (UPF0109 family)
MKELLLYVAKQLVDDPEAVTVTEREDGESTVLELHVAPEDMGKVIGRQGRIAKEIRTIIKAVSQRDGKRVTVDIVDCCIPAAGILHFSPFSPAGPRAYCCRACGPVMEEPLL